VIALPDQVLSLQRLLQALHSLHLVASANDLAPVLVLLDAGFCKHVLLQRSLL
jgi:hypothetical protein